MGIAVDEELFTERDRVEAWRLHVAIELGCSTYAAGVFARSSGDLEQLRKLVAKGCPPDTAVDIVR